MGIQLQIGGFDCIECDGLHTWVYHLSKIELRAIFSCLCVHIALELVVGNLIALLILPVSVTVFLDCIIGEVDYFLPNVIQVELV